MFADTPQYARREFASKKPTEPKVGQVTATQPQEARRTRDANHINTPRIESVIGHYLGDVDSPNRYLVTNSLSRGGYGDVYEAWDAQIGRVVAIKMLPGINLDEEDRVLRHIREAKVAANLEHPAIVPIYDCFHTPFGPAIVMAKDHYPTLQTQLSEGKIFQPDDVRLYIQNLVRTIKFLHKRQIGHADFKPDNLFVHPGMFRVVDFGIARNFKDRESLDYRAGTVNYLAPEFFKVHNDPEFDEELKRTPEQTETQGTIFTLGAIVYEMITTQVFVKDYFQNLDQKAYDLSRWKLHVNYSYPLQIREFPKLTEYVVTHNLDPAKVEYFFQRCLIERRRRFSTFDQFSRALVEAFTPRPESQREHQMSEFWQQVKNVFKGMLPQPQSPERSGVA